MALPSPAGREKKTTTPRTFRSFDQKTFNFIITFDGREGSTPLDAPCYHVDGGDVCMHFLRRVGSNSDRSVTSASNYLCRHCTSDMERVESGILINRSSGCVWHIWCRNTTKERWHWKTKLLFWDVRCITRDYYLDKYDKSQERHACRRNKKSSTGKINIFSKNKLY